MKTKIVFLLCCMILTINSVIAQNSENYYSYSQRMSRYYDSLRVITPDTLKVAGRRQFQRWNAKSCLIHETILQECTSTKQAKTIKL